MRRWLAAAAIVAGAVGTIPTLLVAVTLLGLHEPTINKLPDELGWSERVCAIMFLLAAVGGPVLMCWGLITSQGTEE